MSQKVTVTLEPGEEEKEELTLGKLLLRIIIWGLIIVTVGGALMTGFLGEGFLTGLIGGTEQAAPGATGVGGEQSTEGIAAPTTSPAPGSDDQSSAQPTAAVVFTAIPQPTATPWVYPAPTDPAAPTQPPSPVESACPHIDGEVVWVEIHGSGLRPNCFTIYSWQRIGLISLLSDSVLVTLEDSSLQLAPGARSEFSEPVGVLLTPGAHKLRADPYGSVDVWLEVR